MGDKSSLVAQFKFESYKIDKISLQMFPHLNLLEFQGFIDPSLWNIVIKFRPLNYYTKIKKYIGGFEIELKLLNTNTNIIKVEKELEENSKKTQSLLEINMGIAGIFKFEEDAKFSDDMIQQFTKMTIPTILFPYLRASITSLLANAGFGSVFLPLINMYEVAKQNKETIKLEEID